MGAPGDAGHKNEGGDRNAALSVVKRLHVADLSGSFVTLSPNLVWPPPTRAAVREVRQVDQVQARSANHIFAPCTLAGVTINPAAILIADARNITDALA